MESVGLRCELLTVIFLRLICSALPETTLQITVDGAIKTGVGRYSAPVGRMLQFTCHLRQFPTARLWILRNGDEVLLDRTFTSPGLTEVSYQITGDGIKTTSGNYSCRFYRTIQRRESFPIHFTTENTVEITAFNKNGLPRCASSLGLTGLPGEKTKVFCGTHDSNTAPDGNLLWRGMATEMIEYGSYNFFFADIPLNNQPSDISCGYFESHEDSRDWEEFCSLPPIAVLSHMELTLDPPLFDEMNGTLRFTCQSNPPASLIRWSIFGHNENIISDYYTTKLKGEFRVNITQSLGRSVLQMSSSSVKTDGVHLVTCSTTRENYKIAVSQYMATPSEPPIPTPTKKAAPRVTGYPSSPTGSGSYSANVSQGGSNAGFIVIIVLLIIIVVILGVISLWLYKNQRRTAKNNNGNNNRLSYPSVARAEGLSVAQRSATYEPLNRASTTTAPPAYADLDVGYSTMGPPPMDDQHYMEPSISPSKDQLEI